MAEVGVKSAEAYSHLFNPEIGFVARLRPAAPVLGHSVGASTNPDQVRGPVQNPDGGDSPPGTVDEGFLDHDDGRK
jgi:hypothetical protein